MIKHRFRFASIAKAVSVALVATLCGVVAPWSPATKVNASGTGAIDYAVALNGTSHYISAADSGTVYDGLGSFTFSAWIKPDSTCTSSTSDCMIVNKEASWEIALRNGYIDFAIMGATQNWDWQGIRAGTKALPVVTPNAWNHLVVSVDRAGNDLYIFVNGRKAYELLNNTVSVPTTGRDSNLAFGVGARFGDGTWYSRFRGSIDEVRLYDTARNTEAQAVADMHTWGPATATGLVAYFDFNEGSGSTVVNDSTNASKGPDLTLVNSPT